jgi:hypothetical protein
MGTNDLIIPTLSGYTDVFRPTVSKPDSKAFLFNPQDSRYQLEDCVLTLNGNPIRKEELLRLAGDPAENQPIEENVLIYGIFSYVYLKKNLTFHSSFEIGITGISRYFGVTMGEKGSRLLEKIQSLETVYGILADSGEVFPLLKVESVGSKLRLTSTYKSESKNSTNISWVGVGIFRLPTHQVCTGLWQLFWLSIRIGRNGSHSIIQHLLMPN